MYKKAAIKNSPRRTRQGTINLRISDAQKELIDRAAQALGRNRSDFMLEAASREAEAVLLDRRYFTLGADEFRRFKALLDRQAPNNESLRELLSFKARWEE